MFDNIKLLNHSLKENNCSKKNFYEVIHLCDIKVILIRNIFHKSDFIFHNKQKKRKCIYFFLFMPNTTIEICKKNFQDHMSHGYTNATRSDVQAIIEI